MKRRPLAGTRRLALLAVVVLLTGGLVWGLATAFASSASPSPGAGSVTLKIGWTEEPDNLNPFIGYQNETYEIWALNYDLLFGYGDRNQPTLDLASQFPTKQQRRHLGRRPDLDDQDPLGHQVAGRRAADRRRRRLHLQLHRQEPDGELHQLDVRHQERRPPSTRPPCGSSAAGPRPTSRRMWVPIIPQHIWEHVSPHGGQHELRRQAAARGQRALPDGRLQEGQLHPPGAQPELLGAQAGHRRHLLRGLPGRRHHGHRPEVGQHRRRLGHAAGAVLGPQVRPLLQGGAVLLLQLELPRVQLLRQVELAGQPGAARLEVPQRPELRGRQAAASRSSPTRAMRSPATTIIPPGIWTNPDYHWQPPADQAYTFDLAKAGQLLDPGGLPAELRAACGSTRRASPSSCACSPRPTAPRSRAKPR